MRHKGLAAREPDMSLASNLGTFLLKRLKVFFCVSARAFGKVARLSSD
jgi:hypothetical protein